MRYLLAALVTLTVVSGKASAQQSDSGSGARKTFRATTKLSALMRDPEWRRRRPDIIEGRDLGEKVSWLARGHYVGMTVLTAADERTTYVIVRRTTTSQPEAHARWDDIVMVRSGTGVIVFGDSLVGATLRAPGELRGGQLTTTYQIVVREGDLVRIPAAVPHVFVVTGGEPLEYLVIKTRRPDLPIRWKVDTLERTAPLQ